jgi:hypothetical protein
MRKGFFYNDPAVLIIPCGATLLHSTERHHRQLLVGKHAQFESVRWYSDAAIFVFQ